MLVCQSQHILLRIQGIGIPDLIGTLYLNGKLSGLGIHGKDELIVLQNDILRNTIESVDANNRLLFLIIFVVQDYQYADQDNDQENNRHDQRFCLLQYRSLQFGTSN